VLARSWGPSLDAAVPAFSVGDENTVHAAVNHSKGEWERDGVHTNGMESVWSLFEQAVIGSYYQLSKKHLPAYLHEF